MSIPLYVCYDTSVWTEFGYAIQRYIGSATVAGIRIYIIIFGIGLVAYLFEVVSGINK